MINTTSSEVEILNRIEGQLQSVGWPSGGIYKEPAIRTPGGVHRPDLVLTYAMFPLATLDVRRPDTPATDADESAPEGANGPVPIALESDGVSTWQRGAKDVQRWSPVPTPKELWSLLGREWNDNDPRLQLTVADGHPRLYQAIALAAALDAIEAGQRHVHISMTQGSGKTLIASELARRLLRSGRCHRVLFLTTRRAEASQLEHRLRHVAPEYETVFLQQSISHARIQVATTAFFTIPNRSRLDGAPADFYDLVVVPDLKETSEGWRRIAQHFMNACLVGFSDNAYIDNSFGEPVFRYTVADVLATEPPRIPEGFRAARLGDIASIDTGINPTRNGDVIPAKSTIYARDLAADGSWIQPQVSVAQSEEPSRGDEHSASGLRYRIRPGDILVSAILNPRQPRIVQVPLDFDDSWQFHSSVYRVRVTEPAIRSEDVVSYLRSDAGVRSLLRFAPAIGENMRVSIRDLTQLSVLLPTNAHEGAEVALDNKQVREHASLSAASQALREIAETVVPELIELEKQPHARDPGIVAARLRDIAATLAAPPLSARVLEHYPMPIALAYRRFRDARFNVYEQVPRLRDLFEAAAFFVYNTVLADALRRLPAEQYYVDDKNARTAYDGYSMATRVSFVEAILARSTLPGSFGIFLPELLGSSFITHAQQLQSDFRNYISHSATASESRQRMLLARYEPVVDQLLEEISFLEDYRLARMASIHMRDGKYIRRVELYRGVAPAIDEQVFEPTERPGLAEHDHLVLLNENDDYLDLYPLYQILSNEHTNNESHVCCFKYRKGQKMCGESVQAPIEVALDGAGPFEALRSKLKEKLKS